MSDRPETKAPSNNSSNSPVAPIAAANKLPATPTPAEPVLSKPVKRSWWVWAGVAALIIGGGLIYYYQPFTTKPLSVTVETLKSSAVTRVLAVNGRIAAMHSVDVRAQVSGTLAALPIIEGGAVRMGDVLARINPTAQEAVLRQARASLDAGRVAETLANANYKRLAALKGVVTRSAIETASSNANSASEDVRRLSALLDQAEIQFAKFTVLAPISGTVLAIEGETGQLIDPAMALVTLADLGQLIVKTDVDEAYSTQIKDRMPAVLQLVGEHTTRTGKVNLVARKVNAETGGLAIEIAFDQPVSAPVGLTVTMNITVDKQDAALSVPRAAIVSDATGSFVYVMENSTARKRAISVVEWPADRLIVTKGLRDGEMVIVDATGIADGIKVALAPVAAATVTPKPVAAP